MAETAAPAISAVPDIDLDWDVLATAIGDWSKHVKNLREELTDVTTVWARVPTVYDHAETNDQLYAAMNDLVAPANAWAATVATAETGLTDFVADGRALAKEARALRVALPKVRAAATSVADDATPDADRDTDAATVNGFNEQCSDLARRWEELQQRTADTLSAIAGGEADLLPENTGGGNEGAALPAGGELAALTTTIDDRLNVKPGATSYYAQLRGLDRDELLDWSVANPEAAQTLKNNQLPTSDSAFAASLGERTLTTASNAHPHDPIARIDAIRAAWLSLPPAEQERMALIYPGVLGAMNGIPMAVRVKANAINVVAYRQDVRDLPPLSAEPQRGDFIRQQRDFVDPKTNVMLNEQEYKGAHELWDAERSRRERLASGLDFAISDRQQLLVVNTTGDGRVVAMKGEFSDRTTKVAGLVPGTTTTMGDLKGRMADLNAVDGQEGPDRVSIYWQGADLPDDVPDNLDDQYNENGAPVLAEFNHAVELETPRGVRKTWIGHSAGASLLGTAEREGLTATNIVYAGPAGPGHEVWGPHDTANAGAHRYWLQTRDDPIAYAQAVDGSAQGYRWYSGGDVTRMGPVRLETGFLNPNDPSSLMRGHLEYFTEGSTAASNMQGVVEGTSVAPYIVDELRTVGSPTSQRLYSPLELHPTRYTSDKMPAVTIESLEE